MNKFIAIDTTELKGTAAEFEGAKKKITANVEKCLENRFEDMHTGVMGATKIADLKLWPGRDSSDAIEGGKNTKKDLLKLLFNTLVECWLFLHCDLCIQFILDSFCLFHFYFSVIENLKCRPETYEHSISIQYLSP